MREHLWYETLLRNGVMWQKHATDVVHVKLSSGMHADGFVALSHLPPESPLFMMAAADLTIKLLARGEYNDILTIDRVMGVGHVGTHLARLLADELRALHPRCAWGGIVESASVVGDVICTGCDPRVLKGKRVLLVNDAVNSGGSIDRAISVCEGLGAVVLSPILTIVNHGGLRQVMGRSITALLTFVIRSWTVGSCPHCMAGETTIDRPPDKKWGSL